MNLYNTATTLKTDKSDFFYDNTSSTINNFLIPSIIPTIIVSAIITIIPPLHPSNQYSDSAISYKRNIADVSKFKDLKGSGSLLSNYKSKESIISFSNKLYKKSRSMTDTEYSSVREMVISMANLGLPSF